MCLEFAAPFGLSSCKAGHAHPYRTEHRGMGREIEEGTRGISARPKPCRWSMCTLVLPSTLATALILILPSPDLPLVKVLRHEATRGRANLISMGPSISIAEMSPRTEGVVTSGLELSDSARIEMSPRAASALAEKVRRARAGPPPQPYP